MISVPRLSRLSIILQGGRSQVFTNTRIFQLKDSLKQVFNNVALRWIVQNFIELYDIIFL